jgi:hypothetical protein
MIFLAHLTPGKCIEGRHEKGVLSFYHHISTYVCIVVTIYTHVSFHHEFLLNVGILQFYVIHAL